MQLCLEARGVDDGDVGPGAKPPAGAEGGHLGLGPEPERWKIGNLASQINI